MHLPKKITILAVVSVLLAAVTACGSKDAKNSGQQTEEETTVEEAAAETESSSQAEEEKVLLIIAQGEPAKSLLQAKKIFEAKHPDVLVKIANASGSVDDLAEVAQLMEDSPPDVLQFVEAGGRRLMQQELLDDLTPYIESDGLDMGGFYQGLMNWLTWDGKLSSLPVNAHTMGVYYNKKTFADLGVELPLEGWTWEKFIETANQLTVRDGDAVKTYGVGFPLDVEIFEAFVMRNKGSYLSPDRSKASGFVDGQASSEVYRQIVDLYRNQRVALPPEKDAVSAVLSGEAAMAVDFSYRIYSVMNNPDVGVVTLPEFSGGSKANPFYATAAGIYSKSKHKELAWEFVRLFAAPEETMLDYWGQSELSFSKTLAAATGQSVHPQWGAFIKALDTVEPGGFFFSQQWSDMRGEQDRDLANLIKDGGDVDQILASWAHKFDSLNKSE